MRPARLLIIIALIFLCGNKFLFPQTGLAQTSSNPLIESSRNGLTLTWTPPPCTLSDLEVEGRRYSRLQIPGLAESGQPGYPQLPLYSTMIGLPPTGGVTLRVVQIETDVVQLAYPPLPVPVPQPVHETSFDWQLGGPSARVPDPTLYSTAAFYPAAVAELGQIQQIRHQRVVPLTISPLRVNPVTNQMEVIKFVRVKVVFDTPVPTSLNSAAVQSQSDPFAQALASTLVNPEAIGWSVPSTQKALSEMSLSDASSTTPEFKIHVEEAGLYKLTYNDLLNAGLPLASLNPRTLQVSHGWPRQEVAIWVEGQDDYQFNTGDYVLFYAEPEFSRFVDYDIYFLSYGQGDGQRMGSQSVSPTGEAGTAWRIATAESNRHYVPQYPGRDGDHWYWADLTRPGNTSATYTLNLQHPLTTGSAATLTLWLQSYTDPAQNPDHRLAVTVNGVPVGEHTWNGKQPVAANFTVPANALQDGTNQVSLSLPGLSGVSVEGVWFDAMRLTYPINRAGSGQLIFQGEAGQKSYTLNGWANTGLSVYDITDPAHPLRLTGYTLTLNGSTYTLSLADADANAAKYLVMPDSQIKSPVSITPALTFTDPSGGADYIIITHANFAQAIVPLAQHRANQGLRVFTVDIQEIYDSYGPGRMDPAAIKNFLNHTFSQWAAPAPTYVVLVGDGSYDFKNYSGYNPPTFIPPYLADVDPWWGETAADNQFVTLGGNDSLPEMLIGRLAVNTAAEATTVVNKIIQYETSPAPGNWNIRHIFVADKSDGSNDFHADADQGYQQVQTPFVGQRFYYDTAGGESYLYTDEDALRAGFLNTFNQGVGFVTFHGHSSWLQWAQDGILRYYPPPYPNTYPNDLATMSNQSRLPIVLEMTCFTGSFHRPEVTTIDESMLNLSNGGAVAVWGSTGLGIATGHVSLQAGFYEAINQGERNLGAATLAGKTKLAATGFHQDLLDTFTLFGDPALAMDFSVTSYSHQVYLPIVRR